MGLVDLKIHLIWWKKFYTKISSNKANTYVDSSKIKQKKKLFIKTNNLRFIILFLQVAKHKFVCNNSFRRSHGKFCLEFCQIVLPFSQIGKYKNFRHPNSKSNTDISGSRSCDNWSRTRRNFRFDDCVPRWS